MAFYGIQPSELRSLSGFAKRMLASHAEQIQARQHLAFINNVASLLDDGPSGTQYRINLADAAFADDPVSRAMFAEALTRR